jgi:hypothetical protein
MDVANYLARHHRKRDYERMFQHRDGRRMSADEAKSYLLEMLAQGKRFIPVGECDNFDFNSGCKGHEQSEEAVSA